MRPGCANVKKPPGSDAWRFFIEGIQRITASSLLRASARQQAEQRHRQPELLQRQRPERQHRQAQRELLQGLPRQAREQARALLLSCHRRPGPRQPSRRQSRETCSFEPTIKGIRDYGFCTRRCHPDGRHPADLMHHFRQDMHQIGADHTSESQPGLPRNQLFFQNPDCVAGQQLHRPKVVTENDGEATRQRASIRSNNCIRAVRSSVARLMLCSTSIRSNDH